MKIIIAPTYLMAENYRREQNLDRLSVSIVYDRETAERAFPGRKLDDSDVIDLGRPWNEIDAETISAHLAAALTR